MSERKTSQVKLDSNREYLEKMDDIKIRVPKGFRQLITDYSKNVRGMALNQLVIALLNEDIKAHGKDLHIPSGRRELKNDVAEE